MRQQARLRLNWFSPLPPERTDVAHYTARIAAALADHFDMAFWTPAITGDARITLPGPVFTYDPDHLADASRKMLLQGLNVYHFGNDVRFHRAIFAMARRIPGLAVLHDTVLHDFIFNFYRDADPAHYLGLSRALYGESGESSARKVLAGEITLQAVAADMPFTELFLANAIGAICHSAAAAAEIEMRSDVPVLCLPLPFTSLTSAPVAARAWAPPFHLIMFGYVGKNRRLDQILTALAGCEASTLFHFDLYGTLPGEGAIAQRIATLGLRDRVTLHGFVPENVLDAALAEAHLAFNLRYPTMGEASGGILRSWHHSVPTLVTKAGWYTDLADDIVIKIPLEDEIGAIQAALRRLAAEPGAYRQIGEKAHAFLDAHHRPTAYVKSLATALQQSSDLAARFAARRTFTAAVGELTPGPLRDALEPRARYALAALYGTEPRSRDSESKKVKFPVGAESSGS